MSLSVHSPPPVAPVNDNRTTMSADSCVVGNMRVFSIDNKEIQMPKSDCEVMLMGDCGTKQKNILVSLKPAAPRETRTKKVSAYSL